MNARRITRSAALAAACAFVVVAASATPRAAEVPSGITVPHGFAIAVIARIPRARELAFAPNGDLFIGTLGGNVMLLRDAEGSPRAPLVFATFEDAPAAGVALDGNALYVGTRFGVWRLTYAPGANKAVGAPTKLADVRLGLGEGHSTTSVALSGDRLYIGVGSSCNACTERDPTRASVQELSRNGGSLAPKATHIRNPIALALNPATGSVWAGVAGQDELEHGHPYEIFDPVSAHAGVLDYGWPTCYENRRRASADADCSKQTVPRVVFPAYDTPIGAAFYPLHRRGRYAFPAAYAGGAFVTLHGSWHEPPVPPRVAFVPMRGDEPASAVDWNEPGKQWREFAGGFQAADGTRSGRPTGVAVGPEGSLFVADDDAGLVYRIRPAHD